MEMRDKKTELVIRIAQSAGIIAVAALIVWVDREGMDGMLTGGREWLWALGIAAVLAAWNGWIFDYMQRRKRDSYLDRINAPKRKYAAAPPEQMRATALRYLKDPRLFNLRPDPAGDKLDGLPEDLRRVFARPAVKAVLPEGMPGDLRQLLTEHPFIGLARFVEDTYLSTEVIGPSKLAKNAVRVGYNDANEVVYFPGEQAVYEMYASPEDYMDRLVLGVKDKGEKYLSIYNWLVTAVYENSPEVLRERLALGDQLIKEAEDDGMI
jgi:hypothetical protein